MAARLCESERAHVEAMRSAGASADGIADRLGRRPSTNEQTNGLLQRWLPKGTPLDLNPLRLAIIEDSLNWMPRRLHNWQSAADIYTRLSRNHQ